jgi:DNA (cytosine-5)-methyltransferase 1
MRHGSLFSGIGGFDLAAQWMGWTNVFHTEWNEFGQKVLKHHFPNSISYHDIIKTDFTIHRGTIDIITGGFPCQPFSLAGKRKGTDDERYLWHEMLRAIQQIRPTYVVAENVRGLLTIDGGMVFEQVCADLEAERYEVQPILLPAAGVNAPHRRDRIFIVAYANKCDDRRTSRADAPKSREERLSERHQVRQSSKPSEVQQPAANTNSRRQSAEEHRQAQSRWIAEKSISNNWQDFPIESAICGGNDGIPDRLDNITFPKWRNESIKAYGNAVVPQLILPIFQTIEKLHREKNT